jgi:hypothetical protein
MMHIRWEDMVMRITQADLKGMFDRLIRSAESAGMDNATFWSLHHGNGNTGISYKLLGRRGEGVFAINGYLGMTRRDAYDTLHHYCQVFDALRYSRAN